MMTRFSRHTSNSNSTIGLSQSLLQTGNWNADEHSYFLKAWTRCGSDIDSIVQACRSFCSAVLRKRGDDEVLGHAAWYMQHEARVRRKKELSLQWRRKKNEERDRKVKAELDEQEQREKEVSAASLSLSLSLRR